MGNTGLAVPSHLQPHAPRGASGVAKGTIEVIVVYPQSLQDNPSANFTETDFDSVLLALREVILLIVLILFSGTSTCLN